MGDEHTYCKLTERVTVTHKMKRVYPLYFITVPQVTRSTFWTLNPTNRVGKSLTSVKKSKVCTGCATRETPEQNVVTFSANSMAVCPLGQEIAVVRLIPSAGI